MKLLVLVCLALLSQGANAAPDKGDYEFCSGVAQMVSLIVSMRDSGMPPQRAFKISDRNYSLGGPNHYISFPDAMRKNIVNGLYSNDLYPGIGSSEAGQVAVNDCLRFRNNPDAWAPIK